MSSRCAFLLLAALLGAGGCAPRGELFPPLAVPVVWPSPPAPARISYVGALTSDRDLGQARSLEEVLFGRAPAREMANPYALCLDGAGRVLVADSGASVIHVFDLEQRTYESWVPATDDGAIRQPLGIAWDGVRNEVLVTDGSSGLVFALGADGQVLRTFGGGDLARPCGIAVDATGRRLVVDAATHAVVEFDGDGHMRGSFGGRGAGPGQFNFPTNIAIGPRGRIYVADSLNFRVQVFEPDFAYAQAFGVQGDQPGDFSQPKGVAVDAVGHVYVVDAHFEAVQVFDGDGQLLLTFGREGRGPGEFWLPAGIHVDADDRIWVADSYNRRVQVFQYHEVIE